MPSQLARSCGSTSMVCLHLAATGREKLLFTRHPLQCPPPMCSCYQAESVFQLVEGLAINACFSSRTARSLGQKVRRGRSTWRRWQVVCDMYLHSL